MTSSFQHLKSEAEDFYIILMSMIVIENCMMRTGISIMISLIRNRQQNYIEIIQSCRVIITIGRDVAVATDIYDS